VERGTWMGHVIEHIALDTNIGGYGHRIWRTRETKTLGTYNVVFSYTEERWTLRQNQPLRRRILIAGTEYDLESDLQKIKGMFA
jgi:cyanophycin synthetase